MNANRRRAFTLIEVMIVVVIMAVLAATIIPRFGSSTTDSYKSQLKFNLHFIRSQIELYKQQHTAVYPAFSTFVAQMTQPTDGNGSTSGTSATLTCGPYIADAFPLNPFTNTSGVVAVASPGVVPTSIVTGGAGWQYDETNGGFYPNNAEAYQAGF